MKKVYKMSANVRFKGGTMIAVKGNNHHCTLLSEMFMWSRLTYVRRL